MGAATTAIKTYFSDAAAAWDRFWFAPADPAPLCAIRIAAGAMLLYTHLVWSLGLTDFFGAAGWLSELNEARSGDRLAIDLFGVVPLPTWLLWCIHLAALGVFFLLMVGLFTRVVAVIAWLLTVSYTTHVTPGAFFGLDVTNCMLTMYLMLGPCGARYSLDRVLRMRRGDDHPPSPSVSANLAVRLIQCHLCVIYFFSAWGKLQGELWWDGGAVFLSVMNVEYRSLDISWLIARHLLIGELLTHMTVFIELSYAFLVWNRFTRPWVLLGAIGGHLFIAICLGMITFGVVMIIANISFLSPGFVRGALDRPAAAVAAMLAGGRGGAGQGSGNPSG